MTSVGNIIKKFYAKNNPTKAFKANIEGWMAYLLVHGYS